MAYSVLLLSFTLGFTDNLVFAQTRLHPYPPSNLNHMSGSPENMLHVDPDLSGLNGMFRDASNNVPNPCDYLGTFAFFGGT
jgi:hypothetical protein